MGAGTELRVHKVEGCPESTSAGEGGGEAGSGCCRPAAVPWELELAGPPSFPQIKAEGQTCVPPLSPPISHGEASGENLFSSFSRQSFISFMNFALKKAF